ncbi:MAG: hypothetical protein RBU37_27840 [Myxococcota bacterium]|nr:hypothetical protein [Myxococcota bacterium]
MPERPSEGRLGLRVSWAISVRELRLASRRKLVRTLFIFSLIPLLVFALVIIANMAAEASFGANLGWDPVHSFLKVQAFPVLLLSMALGAPLVAEDRNQDVLFLYATRRVRPFDYAWGKYLGVALPCVLLLGLPSLVMAALRWGVLSGVDALDSAEVSALALLVSALIGLGYAGVALAASVFTHRSRWALILSLGCFFGPEILRSAMRISWPMGPMSAGQSVIEAFFAGGATEQAIAGGAMLLVLGALGLLSCSWRVAKEMIP